MPLTKPMFPNMPVIAGVRLNAVSAGIKQNHSTDLVAIELPNTANVAGVFTQNAFCAAPVTVCRKHLKQTANSRLLLINSGNANACTGEQGMATALSICDAMAHLAGVNTAQVLPFSTGVVGEPLDAQKIEQALPHLMQGLAADNWPLAATGIMTTDTCPKGASACIDLDGETLVVNGIAKGAGMIQPNMATMLAYVVTNAVIDDSVLPQLVKEVADLSFNRITIDGDTSTNDSAILVAAGSSAITINSNDSPHYDTVRAAIVDVFLQLAQSIVRDGEGATKFVTVCVEEGADASECLDVAYAIAHSPLVKTALFASDPNWGRIVVAIGYAGIDGLDINKVKLYLDDVLVVEHGGRASSYTERQGQAVMDQTDITLRVCLGRGAAAETLWTTDLSHEYVRINAEYRS